MSGKVHSMEFSWADMVLESGGGHAVSSNLSSGDVAPGDQVKIVLQEFPSPLLQFLFSNDGGGLLNHVRSETAGVSNEQAKAWLTETPPTVDNQNHSMVIYISASAQDCNVRFDVQLQAAGHDFNFDPLIPIKIPKWAAARGPVELPSVVPKQVSICARLTRARARRKNHCPPTAVKAVARSACLIVTPRTWRTIGGR